MVRISKQMLACFYGARSVVHLAAVSVREGLKKIRSGNTWSKKGASFDVIWNSSEHRWWRCSAKKQWICSQLVVLSPQVTAESSLAANDLTGTRWPHSFLLYCYISRQIFFIYRRWGWGLGYRHTNPTTAVCGVSRSDTISFPDVIAFYIVSCG